MRILVIDDNPLDIELVSRMLHRRLEAAVESVHTAEEGLRRLAVEEFDVVLVDYCLPGQNGLEFLQALQAERISTPVLLVTARGDEKIQEVARRAGAIDYISKDESLTPALPRAVEAAAEKGRAFKASRDRARAEELWHTAEKRIEELQLRVESLQTSHKVSGSVLNGFSAEHRSAVMKALTGRYGELLLGWMGSEAEATRARTQLQALVHELAQLGFGAEQVVSLHTDAVHRLKSQHDVLSSQNGCTPRMLLLELSLSLLDVYRQRATSG